jgi:hypothetical protein
MPSIKAEKFQPRLNCDGCSLGWWTINKRGIAPEQSRGGNHSLCLRSPESGGNGIKQGFVNALAFGLAKTGQARRSARARSSGERVRAHHLQMLQPLPPEG